MSVLAQTLGILVTPYCILMMTVGMLVGLILGAIPGLSGGIAITILLPITFVMDSNVAIAMLISIWVGSCSGGFIGSILLGIPGTPSSLSTVYDGYAMTKKGEVTRALSIGTVSNFLGTLPSIIIAMIACPVISKVAVMMGPWEYFALALMAITLVASLSKGNMLKGFISAGLGLLITQVGLAPISATSRFTFGNYNLYGGFNMISVLTGMFAGSMIFLDYAKGETGAAGSFHGKIGKFILPLNEFAQNIGNTVRSFLIGLGIGFLPGMGAALSNVVAYTLAKNNSKRASEFGTGVADGIIAPEVANNASIGGAIIPMIALGIPGDGTTALLLGGLTIHGIEAGPLLQQNYPVLTQMIFMAALFAAIITLIVEIVGIRAFPMLLKAPYHFLYPAILVISFVGAYTNAGNMFAVFMALLFAGLGIWMQYAGIPGTPFILSYVLGSTLESNFRKAVAMGKGSLMPFVTRPVCCIMLLLAVFSVAYPYISEMLHKKKEEKMIAKAS